MVLLLLLAALLLGLAAFLAAEAATYPARQRRDLLRRVASYGAAPVREVAVRRRSSAGVLAPLLRIFSALVLRLRPKTARDKIGRRLLAAGLAHKLTPDQLLGWKGLLGVSGALFGMLLGSLLAPALGVFLALCFGTLGFFGPDVFVGSRMSTRRDLVQAALPDALDLLAVSVEAGLGFDAAVAKLTEYMEGPLIEELELALSEMRIGESRTEALRRLAARMDVAELSAFVRAIVQADQLGASIATTLRVQAADARTRRQLAAEEKAMKAPITMLFPTALFILPAMFIVVLGPALLNFGKGF
jgi:tight adherence protein C